MPAKTIKFWPHGLDFDVGLLCIHGVTISVSLLVDITSVNIFVKAAICFAEL